MKLLILSGLVYQALAGYDQMEQMANEFLNQNGTTRSQFIPGTNPIQDIWSYGCWCYFAENHGQGRGPPQNDVDLDCRQLHHGYTCIMMDQGCDPLTEPYTAPSLSGKTQAQVIIDCATTNWPNQCATEACTIESVFMMKYLVIWNGGSFDTSYLHSLGTFDHAATCVSGPGTGSTWDCCGDHPNRFPFKSDLRTCCAGSGTTYNEATHDCCILGPNYVVSEGACP